DSSEDDNDAFVDAHTEQGSTVPPPAPVVSTPSASSESVATRSVNDPHSNNPFAKMANNSSQQSIPKNTNPFFKPEQPTQPTYDAARLKAQRDAQRGKSASDDGWSDSENDDDD
ncbi:hypothetical protein WICPIJ_008798, partial [Wickerhamomyces pijperi]